MSNSSPSPLSSKIYRGVAQVTAWTCLPAGLLTWYLAILVIATPPGESIPYQDVLTVILGPNPSGHLIVLGTVLLVGALVGFLTASLHVRAYEHIEHDYQLRRAEALVMPAAAALRTDIIGQCAEIAEFTRVTDFVRKSAPDLRTEYAELVALIVTLTHREVGPLALDIAAVREVVAGHEAEAARAAEVLVGVRKDLADLAPRVRELLARRDHTSHEARSLARDLSTILSALEALDTTPDSNVVPIGTLRPAE